MEKRCENCIHIAVCNKQKVTNHKISKSVCKHYEKREVIAGHQAERITMRDMLIDALNGALKDHFDFVPLNATIGVADQLLARGVTVQPWISVMERLPKSDTDVLVSVKGRDESLIGRYDADWGDWIIEEDLSEKKFLPVTHWHEKPKPVKEDE